MFDPDFPKADPVPRGCGEREPGGVYAESGLSRRGRPLEEFLFDPPLPLPDGLDLINKPQLWQRTLSSGEPALDAGEQPIFDLLIWVGQEHYAYCPDYLEETRRYGASRRLNPNLDLSLLSRSSRMILAHPRVLNTRWQEQRPPDACQKKIPGHDVIAASEQSGERRGKSLSLYDSEARTKPVPLAWLPETPQVGPCLFKLWDLIPREEAQTVIEAAEEEAETRPSDTPSRPLCLREIGSTIYQYRPTGEPTDGLMPGLFAALPLTGFALIRSQDGPVNERTREKMLAALEKRGSHALPFYETDR